MKNIFAIIALGLLLSTAAQAQTLTATDTTTLQTDDEVVVKAGVMFAPQGGITLNNLKAGFSPSLPVFAVVSITAGNVGITPFYNMSFNATGIAIEYFASDNLGIYGVVSKNIQTSGMYSGIGFDTPVANNAAALFIEFGTDNTNTYVFYGVFIPLVRKIHK
ncbi:MAG TPA: hypothetical protein PK950_02000 [Candidatus Paceibacterota bacterium]|nr:hypothetical protein [Candidatus Paceibacterota bacterium]